MRRGTSSETVESNRNRQAKDRLNPGGFFNACFCRNDAENADKIFGVLGVFIV